MQAKLKLAAESKPAAPQLGAAHQKKKKKKKKRPVPDAAAADAPAKKPRPPAEAGSTGGAREILAVTPPPQPYWPPANPAATKLLEPGAAGFDALMARCFEGFVVDAHVVPAAQRAEVARAFEALKHDGWFHHDVVTNGGTRLGLTMVRRHAE